jgi:hypothetical protein
MDFEEKKERAIIMKSKKMWSSNYAPLCYALHGKWVSGYLRCLSLDSGKLLC